MVRIHRNFFRAAILFTILSFVTGVLQAILSLILKNDVLGLPSLSKWVLLTIVVNVAGLSALLIYLYGRQYLLAFVTAILFAVAVISYLFAVYWFITAREMGAYLTPGQILILITGVAYALSILFSPAARRPWLKVIALSGLATSLAQGGIMAWALSTTDPSTQISLVQAMAWVSLFASMTVFGYVLNFRNELAVLSESRVDSVIEKASSAAFIPGFLCCWLILMFAAMLYIEAAEKINWERKLAIKAKAWKILFESHTYRNQRGDTLAYQLLRPLGYDTAQKYPLVVCLPYSHGVEGAPPAQWLLAEDKRNRYPSFIYVPYCPDGAGWGGVPRYPTLDTLVFASIAKLLVELPSIDANRIYVTGVSRGGFGAWNFIALRPDLFAAAIPVCGRGNPALAHRVVHVPVWAFHGEDDMNVPVSGSRDIIAAIRKAGGSPNYTEFKDKAHDIWTDVTGTPGLADWLFAQRRRIDAN